jgi:hypothetical protein
MAEALNIQDTSYAGTAASYMITRAVVGADTVQKGCIYVEDGIKKQRTIPRIEVSGFIQRRAATPVSQGNVTVDGRVLIPQDYMLYYEFNPRDYEQHWYAEQLSPTLLGRELPVTAENFMVMQTMKRLNEWNELAIWRSRMEFDPAGAAVNPTTKGQLATDGQYFYFDGLITKLLNDSETIQVANPVTLTSANVVAALDSCYFAVPKALLFKYGKMGLKFHVSYYTQQLIEEAYTETEFKNNDTTEKGVNRYKGYEIEALAGMPDNTIVLCISMPDVDSNLWLGINSTDDENKMQLQRLQANSELFFIKGLMKADTQIGFTDQAVIYTTLTA